MRDTAWYENANGERIEIPMYGGAARPPLRAYSGAQEQAIREKQRAMSVEEARFELARRDKKAAIRKQQRDAEKKRQREQQEQERQLELEGMSSAELGDRMYGVLMAEEPNMELLEELGEFRAKAQIREEGDPSFKKMHEDIMRLHTGPNGAAVTPDWARHSAITLGFLSVAVIIAAIIFIHSMPWLIFIGIMLAVLTAWLSEVKRNPRIPREAGSGEAQGPVRMAPVEEAIEATEVARRARGLHGTQAQADSHVLQMAREFSELTSK